MRGIDHPSVVKLLSFSESSEHYFLVLERMSSSTTDIDLVINGPSMTRSVGRWRALPPDCQTHLL